MINLDTESRVTFSNTVENLKQTIIKLFYFFFHINDRNTEKKKNNEETDAYLGVIVAKLAKFLIKLALLCTFSLAFDRCANGDSAGRKTVLS